VDDLLLEEKVERFFLKRLKAQFKYMPINEALDFNDRKEIQKMIRADLSSKRFRQEIDKVFKQDFEDALRAAFGMNKSGRVSDYVVSKVSAEVNSSATKQVIVQVCKQVIEKLYKEIALRYPFIIRNLKF
tara:strand:- start:326 stop:715 length:390 start_codon:yes stop_codon:yes gene_type:complete